MDKLKNTSRLCLKFLIATFRHFNQSDGWAMSSHVALSLMLSLFPFLIFATALAGFLGNEIRTAEMVEFVFESWPDEIAAPIIREINNVLTNGNFGFLTFGIGLALLFASNGVEAVRVALNRAYRDDDDRSILVQRIQSVIFVIVGALLILVVSTLLVFVPNFPILSNNSAVIFKHILESEPLRLTFALMILVLVLFACHYWLPVRRRPIAQIMPGISLTLLLWIISARLFSHYVAVIADYSTTYAGLAGIMTALIFLYLMAVVLIYGAEVNYELERTRRADHLASA